jgi:AraC-like DNA-binding protein
MTLLIDTAVVPPHERLELFAEEGTSVSTLIRGLRLDRCRRDLADPARAGETIVSIASRWGLPDPQHSSRLFRSTYGCSPTEFRAQHREPA